MIVRPCLLKPPVAELKWQRQRRRGTAIGRDAAKSLAGNRPQVRSRNVARDGKTQIPITPFEQSRPRGGRYA